MKRILGVLLAAGLAGCQTASPPHPAKTPAPVPVEVASAEKKDVVETLDLPADVKARKTARIYARVPGHLKELRVNLGDRVHPGQVLAVLDTPELERESFAAEAAVEQARNEAIAARQQQQAQQSESLASKAEVDKAQAEILASRAQVTEAAAQLTFKQESYRRLRKVADEDAGLIARQQLDQAWSEKQLAQGQLTAARQLEMAARQRELAIRQRWQGSRYQNQASGSRALSLDDQVESRRQAALKSLDFRDYSLLKAPFAGVVTKRLLDLGGLAGPNVPVLEISEDSVVTISARIPELQSPQVHSGTTLEIRSESLPDEVFSGQVTRVAGALDLEGDRAMLCESDLRNPEHKLKPGMFVAATLDLAKHRAVLAAPTAAVLMEKGKPSVFVVESNRVTKRPVKVGFKNRRWTEISEGLKGGETLVTKGKEKLINGSLVKI